MILPTDQFPPTQKPSESVSGVTVRLAGDSGDGMQLLGTQLTNTSALSGNDVATFPDFPAEIRAPRGTRAGVSGFQVQFSAEEIFTPGDGLDALVCMNPAALITNISDLKKSGILIVNSDSFDAKDLKLAKLEVSPLEDGTTDPYRTIHVPMTKLTRGAVESTGLSTKFADRCKNFFAMGLVFWLFGRDVEPTLRFIDNKFGKKAPEVAEANRLALKAGWNYGETTEDFASTYQVSAAELPSGTYKNVMGNQALAWGLVAAAKLSEKELFLGSYPITPASDILHELSKHKNFGVRTFQAEDEIAAVCSAIGAAFGGSMAVTTSSGPGIALKGEGMGLALMLELPMIIIDVQRGGPSTGLPTKTEQSDLLMAMHGRNGESPLPVIAACSPADCFQAAIEAWQVATKYMVPVMILSDGYIANGAEPWRIPEVDSLPKIPVSHPSGQKLSGEPFLPYKRDENLARPWAIPGTEGLMHRVGGLEKEDGTGNVSYDPDNHQHMVETRARKIAMAADFIDELDVDGPENGTLVLSWGGTYGSCRTAVKTCQANGKSVAHAHLRWINPFPKNLGEILKRYDNVLIPELNTGQLRLLIRNEFMVDAKGFNKIKGKPFAVSELVEAIEAIA
ncbi:2-oxoacid:acceptor oxidoreductase subunit alpha [Mariniblastus fucicola]|uniref:2-oxoglutarate oxidoreductase subunit KorA n=1 Tax=Mariniblastus fucicola TaxID=980251 RepID=A0A5B9PES5_9BACT|nr:2-oxoacid:acceptor oxidoreductase subunit alpha [Mariniblastus fucicola]QEG23705.1 2-oxoglutarate oxidoreductase subunit KorA [Mariniblastus fucicola]